MNDLTIDQLQDRLNFLERKLEGLNCYSPETYNCIASEIDKCKRSLMEIEIQDFYQSQVNQA